MAEIPKIQIWWELKGKKLYVHATAHVNGAEISNALNDIDIKAVEKTKVFKYHFEMKIAYAFFFQDDFENTIEHIVDCCKIALEKTYRKDNVEVHSIEEEKRVIESFSED